MGAREQAALPVRPGRNRDNCWWCSCRHAWESYYQGLALKESGTQTPGEQNSEKKKIIYVYIYIHSWAECFYCLLVAREAAMESHLAAPENGEAMTKL